MTRPALLLAPTTLISPVADPADTASRPQATGTTTLEEMVIQGKAEDLPGIAPSTTKGQASQEELMDRPLLRPGELLKAVPGVVITQHSGGGKANQYFLREKTWIVALISGSFSTICRSTSALMPTARVMPISILSSLN
jgi:hypothetical protein